MNYLPGPESREKTGRKEIKRRIVKGWGTSGGRYPTEGKGGEEPRREKTLR